MDSLITQLSSAATMLLRQLAHFGVREGNDVTPIELSSLDPGTVDTLFRTSVPKNANQRVATLLSESRICLQLVVGFLGAVRALPSVPTSVRFEVPGHRGSAVPVTMPVASATAMIQDAKRLVAALKKHGRSLDHV
jgi:hypothetical protein